LGGNRFGGAMITLPTGTDDPAARLERIRELVVDARASADAGIVDSLTAVLYRLPAWLIAAVPLMDKVDVQVSNFPGLVEQRYLGGAEIVRTYGFGPHPGTPMMIVMISHAGTCCIGVNADAAAVADVPALVRHLEQARDEVLALARPTPARSHRQPAR
jgi:hypothetical protein